MASSGSPTRGDWEHRSLPRHVTPSLAERGGIGPSRFLSGLGIGGLAGKASADVGTGCLPFSPRHEIRNAPCLTTAWGVVGLSRGPRDSNPGGEQGRTQLRMPRQWPSRSKLSSLSKDASPPFLPSMTAHPGVAGSRIAVPGGMTGPCTRSRRLIAGLGANHPLKCVGFNAGGQGVVQPETCANQVVHASQRRGECLIWPRSCALSRSDCQRFVVHGRLLG